ncbi:hypothetical protein [Flavobacterium hungaricum]|uniref:DUF481 domain-containing protein n=1 Tax=Flavobacterium hungaricum TaxID=2082725 RepID=A0ABR9TL61_9FLAO|nr:hypothetical protein [Flavobacterium hungaricum]MBE8726080.1 hypothetical protein [Flavobacterium hungaricum]
MKKIFAFWILTLFWIPIKAQTAADNMLSESLSTNNAANDDFQDQYAEDLPWHARRFKVTAGAFFPVNNTQVQVARNGNSGTMIDLEDDLGFNKSSTSFMGTFDWRISRRSRLGTEYFVLNRSSSKRLEKEIVFKDHTYNVDVLVTAFFDVQIARIYYGYAFLSKPKYEAGLLIGAHVLFGDLGLRTETQQGSGEIRDNFAFTAPLPDVGIWGEFVLAPKFGLFVNANYLSAKVDNISGRIISYNLSVLYNVYQNFSLTAGYTGLNFRIDDQEERLNGFLKWGYNGPTITATYTFGNHVKLYKH